MKLSNVNKGQHWTWDSSIVLTVVIIYLHKHERALLRAESLKDKRYSPNWKWLSINELHFPDKPTDVQVEDEVGLISVALVTVDVVADTSPTSQHHAAPTYVTHTTRQRDWTSTVISVLTAQPVFSRCPLVFCLNLFQKRSFFRDVEQVFVWVGISGCPSCHPTNSVNALKEMCWMQEIIQWQPCQWSEGCVSATLHRVVAWWCNGYLYPYLLAPATFSHPALRPNTDRPKAHPLSNQRTCKSLWGCCKLPQCSLTCSFTELIGWPKELASSVSCTSVCNIGELLLNAWRIELVYNMTASTDDSTLYLMEIRICP